MKWITASDIKNWANTKPRDCQATLPELVRRLILAHTTNAIDEFNFPSGDSVAAAGWDGRLKTSVSSPFFPSGFSGWEIGAGKSGIKKKAEKDYQKRTDDPLGLPIDDTTFVFVTPRQWPGREKWRNGKKSTGTWKDIRVINVDVLEQWIDSTPAVALWLAHQIGKVVSDSIRDIEVIWEEWSIGTKPLMTPELVIAGRTRDVEKMQKWIAGGPGILEVQGDHPDEALAFLYASIASLPKTEKTQALARCVVVENVNDLRHLTQTFQNYPLIIAAPGECIQVAHTAVAKGHHVFISMDATVVGIRDIFQLSRPQRGVVEKVLREGGLPKAEAQRTSRDSGHSIPVLRRRLFQSKAVSAPTWANAKSAQILLPVLFANAWSENKDGDREVIETLSSMNYSTFVKKLTPFLSINDSPVRKVGNVWMIKSPLDTWSLLTQYLMSDQLKLFKQSLLAVLTKTDPKYELEAEKRWAAAIYGKSNPYSKWLRTGLVESLVLISVYGNRSSNNIPTQPFASNVVREVFTSADKWESWASIKDATPLLAEAAPDKFMEAVEQRITKNPTLFRELMKDDQSLFGECRHSGLLWALEGIAWSSKYFARVVNILAELANIDSGGRWGNRAINSLKNIFLPRFPQTYAKPEERLAAIDTLITKYPKIVWEFAQGYYSDGVFSESHRFRWRDAGGVRRGLEPEDNEANRKYLKSFFPKLSGLAIRKSNLIASIDEFTRLPKDTQDRLLNVLGKIDPKTFSTDEKAKLLECIRSALNSINSYDKDKSREQVQALSRVLEKFTPADVIERVGWLLSTPWPRLPQGEPEQYDAKGVAVKTAQQEAARELLNEASLDKILEFAKTVQYPGVLGSSLATAVDNQKEDAEVLDVILEHAADLPGVVKGYALGRVEAVGPDWIYQRIERIKAKGNYSPEACALLFFGLPEGEATWSAVNEQGDEVEIAYWKQASGYSQSSKIDDAPIAVEKLLEVKRPDAALRVAGDPQVSIPSPTLKRLLEDLLKIEERKLHAGVMDRYHLGNVFNQLYKKNDLPIEEVAKLEWPFATLFKDLKRHTSSSMALHRLLQKEPSFFAQLVSFIYRRDDRAPDPDKEGLDEEMLRNRARVARGVLSSWHLMPGLKNDGNVDEKELVRWVKIARKKCAETNRVIGGDLQISFMLAHAPSDPDGAWPHIAVRNLIEDLNNQVIDRHIQIEIYNSRGVTSRGLNEGGEQERELAKKYRKMSDVVKVKWPRTAAVLRGIAKSYEQEAKGHDIESDLHDLRWG